MDTEKVELLQKTLLALDRAMGNHARTELTCCGVTIPQCHALMEIGLAGKASVKDLTRVLGLDKSTLSRTIDGLVAGGFVERTPDPKDRRFVVLMLSKKGGTVFGQINGFWLQFCEELLNNIPEKKQQQVIDSMILIISALEKNDLAKKYLKSCCS